MNDELSKLARKGMLCDPGEHFIGNHEVELKFKALDLSDTRRTLLDLGATPFVLGNKETDVFLDWPDERLKSNGQSLVLREMLPSQRVLWISKGPGKDDCVAMDLPDLKSALSVLQSLGFVQTFCITTLRDIYFLGEYHITLDEVEGLGPFVEIAVMTNDQSALPSFAASMRKIAKQLGLSPDHQRFHSYRELLST